MSCCLHYIDEGVAIDMLSPLLILDMSPRKGGTGCRVMVIAYRLLLGRVIVDAMMPKAMWLAETVQ